MAIKKYLSQAFTIDRLLRAKRAQIAELEERRLAIGSMALTGDKVQTGFDASKFNALSDLYLDALNDYISDERRLLELKTEIKATIDTLSEPTHRLIMTERYINLKRWEDIAVDNDYSWQHVYRTHKAALRWFEKEESK